jgi:hypothetical protein
MRLYHAAKLLVHLALLDRISTTDVQNLLIVAIDDPWSQQFNKYDPQTSVDDMLKSLLIRLLIKEEDNKVETVKNIDMLNENPYNRIAAAIFERSAS